MVKINVDATIFKDQGIYGAGMVLRDDKGSFLKAKSITTQGIPGMKKEKAWALLQAILRSNQMELQHLILKVDCKPVVDGLSSNSREVLEFHSMFANCQSLLNNFPNSRVSLVKRQAKQVAHSLNKASRFHTMCFERILMCIYATILNEIK